MINGFDWFSEWSLIRFLTAPLLVFCKVKVTSQVVRSDPTTRDVLHSEGVCLIELWNRNLCLAWQGRVCPAAMLLFLCPPLGFASCPFWLFSGTELQETLPGLFTTPAFCLFRFLHRQRLQNQQNPVLKKVCLKIWLCFLGRLVLRFLL